MKQYIVKPGWLGSQRGRDVRFVSAETLIQLYGVHKNECKIQNNTKVDKELDNNILIVLAPREDGKYKEYIQSIYNRRKKRDSMIPKEHLKEMA